MIFNIDTYTDKIAIISDTGERLTYSELTERVCNRAKEFQRGVLQFCLCRNDVASVVEYRG